jgi:biopolymer transport protein ExbB/TolQ
VSAAPGSAAGKFQKEIEMKESVRDRWTLWKPFLWSVPLTIVWFLLIFGLKKLAGGNPAVDYIYLFFYRAGQFLIQFVTTYLFGVGLVFLVESWRQLGPEQEMADKADKAMAAVADESGESVISCTVATQMADDIPLEFRRKIGVRRIYELLHGYASGEEPITLNEELSRRDLEQIERGHLLLNAMKQLIPVLGFLGTVVGLSMGMTKFPQAAAQADSVDKLRMILRDFASSLSVAFDTTLLALVYAIVLVILATILTQQEEAFIARVDEIARGLMTRFRAAVPESSPRTSPRRSTGGGRNWTRRIPGPWSGSSAVSPGRLTASRRLSRQPVSSRRPKSRGGSTASRRLPRCPRSGRRPSLRQGSTASRRSLRCRRSVRRSKSRRGSTASRRSSMRRCSGRRPSSRDGSMVWRRE